MTKKKNILYNLWQTYSWWILSIIGFMSFIMGIYGFYLSQDNKDLFDALYLSLQLFTLESGSSDIDNLWFNIARFLSPTIVAFASIKAFYSILQEQIMLVNLKKFREHIVICGLGAKALYLINKYHNDKNRITVIEKNRENNDIASCKARGIPVIIGDATDEVILEKTNFCFAKKVFVITGNDLANIKIASFIKNKTEYLNLNKPLECYVHLFNIDLKNNIEKNELFSESYPWFKAMAFNIFEVSARKIINVFPPDMSKSNKPHIMLIGFGATGKSIVKQAIRMGAYHNKKLCITIIDKFADVQKDFFLSRYYDPDNRERFIFQNVSLNFIQKDINMIGDCSEFISNYNESELPDKFIISLGNDLESLNFACFLENYLNINNYKDIEILVCMTDGSIKNLKKDMKSKIKNRINLVFIDLKEMGCESILEIDSIDRLSRIIHSKFCNDIFLEKINMNQRQQEEFNSKKNIFEKEDYLRSEFKDIINAEIEKKESRKRWEDLDEEFRNSNRFQADHLEIKLRALNPEYNLDSDISTIESGIKDSIKLDMLADMEHSRYCAEKYIFGIKKKYKNFIMLDDNAKNWNRNIALNIPALLRELRNFKQSA